MLLHRFLLILVRLVEMQLIALTFPLQLSQSNIKEQ
ncbi:hypothetical protein P368_21275 [Comamonas thiooxydans]|nr:hypothetical protein P365_22780 [Comamonas thiooxydans]KGH07506.1 hypothetical protein P368_21275 [Comamonas thiooxydans]